MTAGLGFSFDCSHVTALDSWRWLAILSLPLRLRDERAWLCGEMAGEKVISNARIVTSLSLRANTSFTRASVIMQLSENSSRSIASFRTAA